MRPVLIALLLAAAPAFAQAPTPATPTPPPAPQQQRQASPAQEAQQQRMRDCNATAGQRDLKGEDRQKFMSDCLAGRVPATQSQPQPAAAPLTPQQAQQQRMRDCNAEAGTRQLAGDARRDFMSECLAGRMPPRP
jgi:hypothetical protein